MLGNKVEDSSNQAPDDIENADMVTSMRKKLDGLSPLSPHWCINKVPERLRWVKRPAYRPHVVSIGPLHHPDKDNKDTKDLLYMEEHKQRYLQHFLSRTGVSLAAYMKKIKDQDERLRGCYAATGIGFTREFVSIILVDAAFIIELLLRYYFKALQDDNDLQDDDDPIFKKPWMLQNIAPDMILLENQLPFFILEDLFADVKSTWVKAETLPSIIELSCTFFQETVRLRGIKDNNLEKIISSSSEVEHFVDLIRTLHIPTLKSPQTGGPTSSCSPQKSQTERSPESTQNSSCAKKLDQLNTPCAKKLHQAGVKFQVSSSKNLFDIHFNNQGILKIPQVEIHDYTEITLRNLLAFEQCHCRENHIRDYLRFMDGLVNTPMDVDLLVDHGIIVHTLGDNNKVSDLINGLCIGVSWNNENYYFDDLSKELNNYCGKTWNRSKASLKQNYFNSPWAMISVFAAGFLIVLTIIQTACSIISLIN